MLGLRVCSLFSGIGGIDLAFQRAGHRVLIQCEIDAECRVVLRRNWEDVPQLFDIREQKLDGFRGMIDVVAGGFPCQDVSVGSRGKTGGLLGGERSSLWFNMRDIISDLEPSYVFFENVPGLLSSNRGLDFLAVLRSLDELGYYGAWTSLSGEWFGTPQRRARVYGLFGRGRDLGARCGEVLRVAPGGGRVPPPGGPQEPKAPPLAEARVGVCGAIPAHKKRHGHALTTQQAAEAGHIVLDPASGRPRRLTPLECERLQGFPDGWTEGFSDSARYRMLGNAVCVPVVEWIARRLKEAA